MPISQKTLAAWQAETDAFIANRAAIAKKTIAPCEMQGIVIANETVNAQNRLEAHIESEWKRQYPNLLSDFLKLKRADKDKIGAALEELFGGEYNHWWGGKVRTEKSLFNCLGSLGGYYREYTTLAQAWEKVFPPQDEALAA